MQDDRPLVVYILSSSRSGSTALDLALGAREDAVAVGELRNLAFSGLRRGGLCGCGRPLAECSFWQEVFGGGSARLEQVWQDPQREVEDQAAVSRTRHFRRVVRGNSAFLDRPAQRRHRGYLEDLYLSIAARSRHGIVIDSSKAPIGVAELGQMTGIDFYVVHLVRDPRAVAFSVLTPKQQTGDPSGRSMTSAPAWKTAAAWNILNLQGEVIRRRYPDRYLRVRYEDLVTSPEETLRTIWDSVHQTYGLPPSTTGTTARIQHTAWGNPMREGNEAVVWRADRRWTTEMTSWDKSQAALITAPLRRRYGYSL